MPDARAHIYELALRTLDEQRDEVSQLHGRIAPALAVGGVGITLLARPVFAGDHPSGALELAGTLIGLLGLLALLLAGAHVLRPRPLAFSLNAEATLAAIRARDPGILDDATLYYETMITALTRRHAGNQPIVDRLHTASNIAVFGLLAELGGLGLTAALAS